MTKLDYMILGFIVSIYAILSFVHLGSFENPVSFVTLSENEEIIFSFNEPSDIKLVKIYTGTQVGEYRLEGSIDGKNYQYFDTVMTSGAFGWDEVSILKKIKYLKMTLTNGEGVLGEIGFYDNDNHLISSRTSQEKGKVLLDEQKVIPNEISYLNSSYFDEIYFARSAYEYTKGLPSYEWTHPPLGKLIQALPIKLFTMTPFYYRFMGNVSGILMIVIMYLFGKVLFQKRRYAIAASLLMALDTFHFAQSRMGTVDVYLVLFIMISTLFMFYYLKNPTGKNRLWNLFFSGIFFGLSICIKWTGLWCGFGLAILLFTHLFQNRNYFKIWKKPIRDDFIICFLSFVVIPIILYSGCYFCFPKTANLEVKNVRTLIQQTEDMYQYHSTLEAQHPFTSKFYTWPISYKPVWYYTKVVDHNHRQTISGVGNIMIWWVGVLALIYLLLKAFIKKDSTTIRILIMFLSLYLPYLLIGRVMFLYHYFPTLPFMMLAVIVLIADLEKKFNQRKILPIYLILVLFVFILYYPVASGMTVSNDYINALRILKSWTF